MSRISFKMMMILALTGFMFLPSNAFAALNAYQKKILAVGGATNFYNCWLDPIRYPANKKHAIKNGFRGPFIDGNKACQKIVRGIRVRMYRSLRQRGAYIQGKKTMLTPVTGLNWGATRNRRAQIVLRAISFNSADLKNFNLFHQRCFKKVKSAPHLSHKGCWHTINRSMQVWPRIKRRGGAGSVQGKVCRLVDRPVNRKHGQGTAYRGTTLLRTWYKRSYCHTGNQGAKLRPARWCHHYKNPPAGKSEYYKYSMSFAVVPGGKATGIYPQGDYNRTMRHIYNQCRSCCGNDNACLCNCALSNKRLIFNAGRNGDYAGGVHLKLSWGAAHKGDDVKPGWPVWGNPFANPNRVVTRRKLAGLKGVSFSSACKATLGKSAARPPRKPRFCRWTRANSMTMSNNGYGMGRSYNVQKVSLRNRRIGFGVWWGCVGNWKNSSNRTKHFVTCGANGRWNLGRVTKCKKPVVGPSYKWTTCKPQSGRQQRSLSGDGAPPKGKAVVKTKKFGGEAQCQRLCRSYKAKYRVSGCCRYAEGIPPHEANPAMGITTRNGARCWFVVNGQVAKGDPSTSGWKMP